MADSMRQLHKVSLILLLLCRVISVPAQNNFGLPDSSSIYKEFIKFGEWYNRLPIEMDLHFISKSIPQASGQENMETDMKLHYGRNYFYMKAEGLEQIANDSMVVMVNSDAKIIRVFPNNKLMVKSLDITSKMFYSDSSFQQLVSKYSAVILQDGKNNRKIVLRTRDLIFGTSFPKETISISYHPDTHQPVTFHQSKLSLVPIDSSMYNNLASEEQYHGRVVSTQKNDVPLFFMVKEQQTSCIFTRITHEKEAPPVRVEDRVIKLNDGAYQPAKGFEGFLISKEY